MGRTLVRRFLGWRCGSKGTVSKESGGIKRDDFGLPRASEFFPKMLEANLRLARDSEDRDLSSGTE